MRRQPKQFMGKTCKHCHQGFRVPRNVLGKGRKFCSVYCSSQGRKKPNKKLDPETVGRLYVLGRASTVWIANEFGVDHAAVRACLIKQKIPLRNLTEARNVRMAPIKQLMVLIKDQNA